MWQDLSSEVLIIPGWARTRCFIRCVCYYSSPLHLVSCEGQSASWGSSLFGYQVTCDPVKNTGRREGRGRWGAEGLLRLDPRGPPASPATGALPEPPALRVLRSAAVPAAAAGGRPRTAPAGRLLPRGEPLRAPEIDLLVHTRIGRPRVGAGGRRLPAPRLHRSWRGQGLKCSKGSVEEASAVPSFQGPVPPC